MKEVIRVTFADGFDFALGQAAAGLIAAIPGLLIIAAIFIMDVRSRWRKK